MNRFLLGALTTAALLVLTSFVAGRQEQAAETKVVQHEGNVTYVWEMRGSEVVGVTTYTVGLPPPMGQKALRKEHHSLQEEKK
jgi:hypothetical protein